VDLAEGEHEYKFLVDGQWMHDPTEPVIDNGIGSKNNVISVKKSDFEVFDALDIDSSATSTQGQGESKFLQGLSYVVESQSMKYYILFVVLSRRLRPRSPCSKTIRKGHTSNFTTSSPSSYS
jgi:Glycogen recognition site of AMP-activated protein kinase